MLDSYEEGMLWVNPLRSSCLRQTVLGDNLFCFFVDEGQGCTSGRDVNGELGAGDGIAEIQIGFVLGFVFEDVEDGVLQIDGIDQHGITEKNAAVPGGRDVGAFDDLLVDGTNGTRTVREFEGIRTPEELSAA